MKIGNTTLDLLGPCPNPRQFMNVCEGFTIDMFNKHGNLHPFSIFLAQGQMLLAQWNFNGNEEKNKAMAQARAIARLTGTIKYFSASEVWVTVLSTEDPEVDAKIKKIQRNGVEQEPGRQEKVILIMETKGEKITTATYDIVPDSENRQPRLKNRQVMSGVDSGRMVGILQ